MIMRLLKTKKIYFGLINILFVGNILSAYPPNYESAMESFMNQKYEESLNKIREVFDNYKNSLEFRLLAAANYIELNNYDNALAHLRYAMNDHPDSYEVSILMSEVYIRKKQFNNATNLLYQAYNQFKNDKQKDIQIRYQIAKASYFAKNYQAARKQLETIIAQNPTFMPAFYLDGLIYLQQNNYELAQFRFNAITSLKEVDKDLLKKVYNNLGVLQELAAKNNQEAIKYYKKALSIDPNYDIAKSNLARLEK